MAKKQENLKRNKKIKSINQKISKQQKRNKRNKKQKNLKNDDADLGKKLKIKLLETKTQADSEILRV